MPENIVVIDEQPVILQGLTAALQPFRFRVTGVDFDSASSMIEQHRPRLVVVESRIGLHDGLQLLEQLRLSGSG